MIELEALGAVGGREGQRRVVAPQLVQASPDVGDPGGEVLEGGRAGCPAEEGGGNRQAFDGRVVLGIGRSAIGRTSLGQAADGEEGAAAPATGRRSAREQLVDDRRLDRELQLDGPKRHRQPERRPDHGQQLAVRPREHRPRPMIVRPRGEDRRGPVDVVGRRRRKDEPARRLRTGADRLGEALLVVLDEPDRPLEHGRWAAVVGFEVHPQEAR